MTDQTTNPNEYQVGGSHYKAEYQHWDFVEELGLGYLEGCATKYVVRWREKNGIQDLHKALHYTQKLYSVYELGARRSRTASSIKSIEEAVEKLSASENLSLVEREFCLSLALLRDIEDINNALSCIQALIEEANEA